MYLILLIWHVVRCIKRLTAPGIIAMAHPPPNELITLGALRTAWWRARAIYLKYIYTVYTHTSGGMHDASMCVLTVRVYRTGRTHFDLNVCIYG